MRRHSSSPDQSADYSHLDEIKGQNTILGGRFVVYSTLVFVLILILLLIIKVFYIIFLKIEKSLKIIIDR